MTPRRRQRSVLARWSVKLLQSRTVWLALAQAVAGVITAAVAANPALGWLVIAKSVVDIWLRALTTEPIGKGQP